MRCHLMAKTKERHHQCFEQNRADRDRSEETAWPTTSHRKGTTRSTVRAQTARRAGGPAATTVPASAMADRGSRRRVRRGRPARRDRAGFQRGRRLRRLRPRRPSARARNRSGPSVARAPEPRRPRAQSSGCNDDALDADANARVDRVYRQLPGNRELAACRSTTICPGRPGTASAISCAESMIASSRSSPVPASRRWRSRTRSISGARRRPRQRRLRDSVGETTRDGSSRHRCTTPDVRQCRVVGRHWRKQPAT